jgi:hypothetical protein
MKQGSVAHFMGSSTVNVITKIITITRLGIQLHFHTSRHDKFGDLEQTWSHRSPPSCSLLLRILESEKNPQDLNGVLQLGQDG